MKRFTQGFNITQQNHLSISLIKFIIYLIPLHTTMSARIALILKPQYKVTITSIK